MVVVTMKWCPAHLERQKREPLHHEKTEHVKAAVIAEKEAQVHLQLTVTKIEILILMRLNSFD